MPSNLEEDVQLWVQPQLTEQGLDLYDVEFAGGVLRVLVDRQGGVGLDEVATFTRRLSHLLDERDPIKGTYTLEVSSPGVERKLRRPEHWAGAIDQRVKVKLRAGTSDDRRLSGIITSVDETGATIQGDDASITVAFADVESARTVFVWPSNAKPTGSNRSKKSPKRTTAGSSSTTSAAGDPVDAGTPSPTTKKATS